MNKTLLQILLDELPKRGGWPDGAAAITQDKHGDLSFIRFKGDSWNMVVFKTLYSRDCRAIDHTTAIVTKEQYEAALNQAR